MKNKKALSLMILFLAVLLISCQASAMERTVKLDPGKAVTRYVLKGDTVIILAEPYLTWSSSKPYVAKVTQTGLVKALRKGKTLIKAKKDGVWYACSIVVETPSIDPKKLSIEPGDRKLLEVIGTKQKVRWKSANSKIASVNKKGRVTAKREGTTLITAYVGDKALSCKVTVNPPLVTSPPFAVVSPPTEYNLQPDEGKPDNPLPDSYFLNTRTMEIHLAGCRYLEAMDESELQESTESYGHIRLQGYLPCRSCMKNTERFP